MRVRPDDYNGRVNTVSIFSEYANDTPAFVSSLEHNPIGTLASHWGTGPVFVPFSVSGASGFFNRGSTR